MRKILFIFSFLLALQICLPEESYAEGAPAIDMESKETISHFFGLWTETFTHLFVLIDSDGDGEYDTYFYSITDEDGWCRYQESGAITPEIVMPSDDVEIDLYSYQDCIDNRLYTVDISGPGFTGTMEKYCDNDDLFVTIVDDPVYSSIQDDNTVTKAWPMPAYDFLNVEFENMDVLQDINIVTANGATITNFTSEINNNSIIVNVKNLQAGVYILNLSTEENIRSIKFVKK